MIGGRFRIWAVAISSVPSPECRKKPPTDLESDMTFSDALERFAEMNAAGKVPDRRRNDRTHTISAARRDVIVSHTRAAVARAMGLPRDDHAALDAVDLRPLVETLPDIAYRGAEEAQRAAPRNERANVALFLATVFQHTYGTQERRPGPSREDVLPAWRPSYDALVEDAADPASSKNSHCRPGLLVRLQHLMLRRGIHSPKEMEDSYEWFIAIAEEEGVGRSWTAREMLASLRRARELLGDESIPTLYQQARPGERGVGSLPDLAERLARHGSMDDPRTMTPEELIEVLAPKLYSGLARRLEQARRENLRPSRVESYVSMTSKIVASLARMGIDPATKTFIDLFTEVDVVEGGEAGESDPVLAEVMGADYIHIESRSLMRRVIDESGRLSYQTSPIQVVGEVADDGDAPPMYTARIIHEMKTCFTLVRAVYGDALAKHQKDRWVAAETEYKSLLRHVTSYNERRVMIGHQNKEKVLITWPQAVCMFLPWLARRIEKKQAELERWRKTGREGSRTHKKHLRELDVALREWVLAALLLDDGLRIKNYAGAVVNRHIIPTVERDADGRWIGFLAVETRWRGIQDAPQVVLKIGQDSSGRERKRTRQLTPGIVRLDFLFQFWTQSRARDLVRRGVLGSVEEYDPDADDWALFVSPKNSRRKSATRERPQHVRDHLPLGKDYLSRCFARLLHQFVREVLGRDEVPAWDDPERTQGEWKGLFSAHISRTLIATYVGGICDNWNLATHLTDDDAKTLKVHYSRIRDQIHDLLYVDGPENPRWFDTVIARLRKKLPGDDWPRFWAEFNPEDPTAALDRLVDGKDGEKGA